MLRHRRFRDEVGLRDLASGETADRSERQRDRRRRREIRMGAQEVKVQGVVGVRHCTRGRFGVEAKLTVATRAVRPCHIEKRSPRNSDQPTRGIAGRLVGPVGNGSNERLLHGVLGRREIGSATDEDAQYPRDELTQLGIVHGCRVSA
jgi:hypothetical protein